MACMASAAFISKMLGLVKAAQNTCTLVFWGVDQHISKTYPVTCSTVKETQPINGSAHMLGHTGLIIMFA